MLKKISLIMIIIIPGAGGRIGFELSRYLFEQGHKLILGALEKFIKSGELHAVSLETLLPEEDN